MTVLNYSVLKNNSKDIDQKEPALDFIAIYLVNINIFVVLIPNKIPN